MMDESSSQHNLSKINTQKRYNLRKRTQIFIDESSQTNKAPSHQERTRARRTSIENRNDNRVEQKEKAEEVRELSRSRAKPPKKRTPEKPEKTRKNRKNSSKRRQRKEERTPQNQEGLPKQFKQLFKPENQIKAQRKQPNIENANQGVTEQKEELPEQKEAQNQESVREIEVENENIGPDPAGPEYRMIINLSGRDNLMRIFNDNFLQFLEQNFNDDIEPAPFDVSSNELSEIYERQEE